MVHCNENERLRRLLLRNPSLTEQEALSRMKAQISDQERLNLADAVIDNENSREKTEEQTKKLFKKFNDSREYLKLRVPLVFLISLFLAKITFSLF